MVETDAYGNFMQSCCFDRSSDEETFTSHPDIGCNGGWEMTANWIDGIGMHWHPMEQCGVVGDLTTIKSHWMQYLRYYKSMASFVKIGSKGEKFYIFTHSQANPTQARRRTMTDTSQTNAAGNLIMPQIQDQGQCGCCYSFGLSRTPMDKNSGTFHA